MSENLLLMSLSGSAVFLLCWLACRLAGNRLSARWQYTAMKLVPVFLLFPVGPWLQYLGDALKSAAQLPEMQLPLILPEASHGGLPEVVSHTATAVPHALPQLAISPTAHQVLITLWGVCAAAVLVWKFVRFAGFRRRLRQAGLVEPGADTQLLLQNCRQKLGVRKPVQLWISSAAPGPFATGLLHPRIVLPDRAFSQRELQYILLHELTHIKSGDLWVRWISMLAAAVHWWNPAIYLWNRKMVELSEESCDERVVLDWPSRERIDYGRVLLKTACAAAIPEGLTTSISATKLLQRRLSRMFHTRNLTKKQKMISAGVILALLVCGSAAALAVQSPVVIREESEAAGQTSDFASSQGTASDTMEQRDPVPAAPQEDYGEVQEDEASDPPARAEQERAPASSNAAGAQDDADGQNAQSIEPADDHTADTSIYADAVRGDTELILARGGTLLPDNDLGSYREVNGTFYKLFAAKGSTPNVVRVMAEYEVGNWEILNSSEQKIASETLVNGEYPKNSHGESYGSSALANYVGYSPDLIAAVGTHGESGYIRDADTDVIPDLSAEECPHEFMVPLYDSEGEVIGEFAVSCGGHFSGGMTIEEAKEAIAAGLAP